MQVIKLIIMGIPIVLFLVDLMSGMAWNVARRALVLVAPESKKITFCVSLSNLSRAYIIAT